MKGITTLYWKRLLSAAAVGATCVAMLGQSSQVLAKEVVEASQVTKYTGYPTAGTTPHLGTMTKDALDKAADDLSKKKIVTKVSYTRWVKTSLNIRKDSNTECEIIGGLSIGDKVEVTGEAQDSKFVRINYKGKNAYVHSDYLSRTEVNRPTQSTIQTNWSGPKLNRISGRINGPSGEETFYNLNMSYIVARMHRAGYEGDYWVRSDGVKMLGNYVMVAANLSVHPRGSIVPTSLGMGRVCDTGSFAISHPHRLDIATSW